MAFLKHTDLSTGFLHEFQRIIKLINILIAPLCLFGCISSATTAPVATREQPPSEKLLRHRVAPGETLYSIAWRYDLDHKVLARWNSINSAEDIFPSQIIWLQPKKTAVGAAPTRPVSSHIRPSRPMPAPVKTAPSRPGKTGLTVARVKPSHTPLQHNRSEKKSTFVTRIAKKEGDWGKVRWEWPSSGKVLTHFSARDGLKRGIDIQGKKGDSVNAAASGRVVYAGSGLRGYGKLLIIKHNDVYLSAYAHNHLLYVQEGDDVKVGQRIAAIGSTGTGAKTPKLHFQIRKEGKPINPLQVLPRKRL